MRGVEVDEELVRPMKGDNEGERRVERGDDVVGGDEENKEERR